MRAATQAWVEKPEVDFEVASDLSQNLRTSRYDAHCFLTQQCVQECLKPRLADDGIATHPLTKGPVQWS